MVMQMNLSYVNECLVCGETNIIWFVYEYVYELMQIYRYD